MKRLLPLGLLAALSLASCTGQKNDLDPLPADDGLFTLNAGVRASWWSWNRELTVSPRLLVGFTPAFNEDFTFRFSTGVYYQTPFYKEIKDTVSSGGIYKVNLNERIKAQRSVQFVLGGDYDFRVL